MPIYEYVCNECSTKYDKLVRSTQTEVKLRCPVCGSPKAKKAFSAFSTGRASSSLSSRTASAGPACGPVG